MDGYLMDTNVIIGLWNHYPFIIDKIIKDARLKILEEIGQELVLKEKQEYEGKQVLSERFCKLLPWIIKVDKEDIRDFYSMLKIKYSKKGKAYYNNTEKLSENDLILLYACYLYNNLILVTEDKHLYNTAIRVLGKEKVINLNMLVHEYS